MDRIFKDHLSPGEPTIAVDESFVAADDSFMPLTESPVDDGPACEVPTTLSGIVTV